MEWIHKFIDEAIHQKASDLHICPNHTPMLRITGRLVPLNHQKVSATQLEAFLQEYYPELFHQNGEAIGELDTALEYQNIRLRLHAFRNMNGWSLALRLLPRQVPTLEQLYLPPVFKKLAQSPQGLVIITGPTGSGKSTTLAAVVEEINRTRPVHIITIEDPIEYVYQPRKALIQQREVGHHARSFAAALRAALREDPDVILVGEMRDLETIRAALEAAETGHLVFSTLHTNSAAETVERIVGVFPEYHQAQIRIMLANALLAVVSQRLVPAPTPLGRVALQEILIVTPAIRNLIRENKTFQIPSAIQTGSNLGMQTVQQDIQRLRRLGIALNPEYLEQFSAEVPLQVGGSSGYSVAKPEI